MEEWNLKESLLSEAGENRVFGRGISTFRDLIGEFHVQVVLQSNQHATVELEDRTTPHHEPKHNKVKH